MFCRWHQSSANSLTVSTRSNPQESHRLAGWSSMPRQKRTLHHGTRKEDPDNICHVGIWYIMCGYMVYMWCTFCEYIMDIWFIMCGYMLSIWYILCGYMLVIWCILWWLYVGTWCNHVGTWWVMLCICHVGLVPNVNSLLCYCVTTCNVILM